MKTPNPETGNTPRQRRFAEGISQRQLVPRLAVRRLLKELQAEEPHGTRQRAFRGDWLDDVTARTVHPLSSVDDLRR